MNEGRYEMRIVMLALLSSCVCSAAFAESEWSIDKPTESIPAKPLTGTIFGTQFVLGSAEINNHGLTIKSKSKSGMWPESQLVIFVNMKEGKKEWTVTPESEGDIPHVHMMFAKKGKSFPGTLMFIGEYSMKLVFTEVTKSKAKGKIHISLPDYKRSYLIGSFTADVK